MWFTGEGLQHKKEATGKLQNDGEGRFQDAICTSGRNRGQPVHTGQEGSEERSVIPDPPEHMGRRWKSLMKSIN